MATITLGGNEVHTLGALPATGTQAPDVELVKTDLSRSSLSDYRGKKVLLNIFPSVNTGVCSASVRHFNQSAAGLNNTVVLCISRDLPFAQQAFCAAEGIENVVMLSDYRDGRFGKAYNLTMTDGGFEALLSRCVIILDAEGVVHYTQQVPEIGQEPNYQEALDALENA
ncbi:thiol peroxidase [Robiginitalea sp. M366]|uniref:thiol peroxidase n=1 Tax=Robiginitalea aestuariiviva TaxID=3036903 RepID=UPI00240D6ECE|nr:thiol peroxidase [Robiginitalea aestuariiviva]MDG1572816.1 thiol peroxidase [Robiginitalea aestuariiviva]